MREFRSGSAGDGFIEVLTVAQGGTGVDTPEAALDVLGGLRVEELNQPGTAIVTDEGDQVPIHLLKSVIDNSISLAGPVVTQKGLDHDWTITNFDSASKYEVWTNFGHVTLTDDNIHLFLPVPEQMVSPLKLNVARNGNTRYLELPIIDGRNTYYQTSRQTTSNYVAVNTSFTTSVETQLDGQNVNTTYSGTRVTYLAGTHNTVHNTTYNTQHGTTVLTNFQTTWSTTSSANQNTYWNTTVPGEYRNTSSGSWQQASRQTSSSYYTYWNTGGLSYSATFNFWRYDRVPAELTLKQPISHYIYGLSASSASFSYYLDRYGLVLSPSTVTAFIKTTSGPNMYTFARNPSYDSVGPDYHIAAYAVNGAVPLYDGSGDIIANALFMGYKSNASSQTSTYTTGYSNTYWNTYVTSSWQTLGDPTQRQTSMLTTIAVSAQTSQNTSRNTIAATVYQTNNNTDRETANAESTIQTTFKTSAMTMTLQSNRQTTFTTTQDTAFGAASQYTQYLTGYQTTLNGQLVNTSHLTERQTDYPGGIRQTSWSVSKNTIINPYPVGTEWNTSRSTVVSGASQNTSFTTTHQTYVTGGTGQTSVLTTKQTIQPGVGPNAQTAWNTSKVTTTT